MAWGGNKAARNDISRMLADNKNYVRDLAKLGVVGAHKKSVEHMKQLAENYNWNKKDHKEMM